MCLKLSLILENVLPNFFELLNGWQLSESVTLFGVAFGFIAVGMLIRFGLSH